MDHILSIAKVCHEANRAWCAVNGDDTQRPWDDAEQWQRDSAVLGVKFALANPDAPDSAQHNAWMTDKLAAGWRFGDTKDSAAKTHPCIVPFEQLPHHQQAKDKLFKAVVASLA